jgi:hypothetical protein
MADDRELDHQLVAVTNELLDAVYQAKQAAWPAGGTPLGVALHELVTYLIDESHAVMDAEANLGGPSPDVTAPSTHQRGNLMAEVHGDLAAAVATLVDRLQAVVDDIRTRSSGLGEAGQVDLLVALADGLERRLDDLRNR